MNRTAGLAALLVAALIAFRAPPAPAADIEVRPGTSPSLRDAFQVANPGDRILMRAGVHRGGDWLGPRSGTAAAPITILSADGPRRAVLEGGGETLRIGDASSYLVIDGLEVRNSGDNAIHIDGGCHHVTLRNVYAHHAGQNGDVLKVNQSHHITVERCELAYPGRRDIAENPCQEDLDFLDVDDAVIRDNYLHDSCAMLMVLKGGSRRGVVERNLFVGTGTTGGDPSVGLGGASDRPLLMGEQYEAIGLAFRNNVIWGGQAGGLGIYDCQGCYVANNLLLNVDRALVEFRAGEGPAARSEDVRLVANLFVDTRGRMPAPVNRHSHALGAWSLAHNTYWNNGGSIPAATPAGLAAQVPAQPGYAAVDPLVGVPAVGANLAAIVGAVRPRAGSPAAGTGADYSGAPFGVADDFTGASRAGRRDRGPFALSLDGSPPPPPAPIPPVDGGAPPLSRVSIPAGQDCLCVCR